jgi:hypothetical protein
MMVEKTAVGRREGGRRSKKAHAVDQTAGMAEWASTPLEYPSVGSTRGETERLRRREPKIV